MTAPPGDNLDSPAEKINAPSGNGRQSLLRAAGLIAVVTVLSKLLGAVRDWAIVYVYGTSLVTDAYFAAFQIPSFAIVLLGGLGGPFHTATVSVFSKLIKDDEYPSEKARKLANAFITLTALVFTGLSILTFFFAKPILQALMPGASDALINNATIQMQIMSPTLFVGGLVGIFYGFLNIYNNFFWPSFSPAAMSLVLLIALWINPHDPTGYVLAWATLGGAIFQFLCQLPDYLKYRFHFRPSFNFKTPELKHINELLLPATIGTTIGQLVAYVDMFFASALQVGGWSAVTLSNRLIQFPIGVLQTALLVPIFPRFSRFVAENNMPEIKRHFKMGVVSLWFISIPVLVVMVFDTEVLIRLIFQHGQFTADNTTLVSHALLFQAFQMLPYFARDSLTRVFYAFHDSKTPLMIGLLAIGIKAALNAALVGPFGVGGITFATTLITFINMLLLAFLSKRHIQDLGFKEMLWPFAKLMTAGGLMAGSMLAITHYGPSFENELVTVAFSAAVGCLVYVIAAISFKVAEAEYLFNRLQTILQRNK